MEAVITKKTELDIENIEYRDIRELTAVQIRVLKFHLSA